MEAGARSITEAGKNIIKNQWLMCLTSVSRFDIRHNEIETLAQYIGLSGGSENAPS
jgi:hypothetical protein